MSSGIAKVEIRTHGDNDTFWLVAYLNGFEVNGHVPVESIEDGTAKAERIDKLVRDVYRRAYRDGVTSCQRCVKEALGISN
jgi:hypothetical protein